mmetsp:Transcript_144297/g.462186  ORF Transcript_144297/g.462186 Transcript_144297/m.462186 type:complete len:471 (-) Transcript_144297:53-1465(-)
MSGHRPHRSRSCDSAAAAALQREADDFSKPHTGAAGSSPEWLSGYPVGLGPTGSLGDVASAAWPVGRGDKALLRRKMLQPLAGFPPRPPALGGSAAADEALARPGADVGGGWPFGRPPLAPSLSPSPSLERPTPPRAAASAAAAVAPPAPLVRPSTSDAEGRPRTAGSRNRPPLGGDIAFPAQLRLRGPGEAPGPLRPFAGPGECLVIPLETQHAIRCLAASCGEGRQFVTDGKLLTVWAIVSEGGVPTASCPPNILEPLAARKLDREMAVEPIELALERQGARTADDVDGQVSLRYGEGFRLRAAGCSSLYLGHGGDGGGLRWISPSSAPQPTGTPVPPHGTRFAAHGGELGAPLLMGRPLSLQRVTSPPPSPEDSEVSDSESDDDDGGGDGSDSDGSSRGRRRRRRGAGGRRGGPQEASTSKSALAAAAAAQKVCSFLPEAKQYQAEGLFSRAGDGVGAFPVTFLPLM